MEASLHAQLRTHALDIVTQYRVCDLQTLLDYARLSRQGNKRELFQRCKLLVSSYLTPQLAGKIQQINQARVNSGRALTSSRSFSHQPGRPSPIALPTPSLPPATEMLLPANRVQYVPLPFFDKIRTIECVNVRVDWTKFSPLRFTLTDFDAELLLKGLAKVFIRIAPTLDTERHNDVLPPYLFVQCNGQTVLNNNIAKVMGAPAHSAAFPTDITESIVPRSNAGNTLTYLWLQPPSAMLLKNLPKSYTLTLQLVRCVSLDSLADHVLKREPKHTHGDNDPEVEDVGLMATRHRVSLICPVTQALIGIPVKSSSCSHPTCFDLRAFLQMNQRRLRWTCPLCKKPASYESLQVDKRLQSILAHVPAHCSTVEIDSSTNGLADCQYILDTSKPEKRGSINDRPQVESRRQSIESECVLLSSGSESDDDDDVTNDSPGRPMPCASDAFQQHADRPVTGQERRASSPQDDGVLWEDIARFAYDFISHDPGTNQNGKRCSSEPSSAYDEHRRKRTKRADEIDVITLSSSNASDSDDLA